MNAISLWQPWASSCVRGTKGNETRHWQPPKRLIGKRLVIHAAKRWQKEEREWAETLLFNGFDLGFDGTPPLGCIVGSVLLAGCLPTESLYDADFAPVADWDDQRQVEYQLGNYGPGRFAWVFAEPIQYANPLPWKGSQGFFEVPDWVDDPVTYVTKQLAEDFRKAEEERFEQMVLGGLD